MGCGPDIRSRAKRITQKCASSCVPKLDDDQYSKTSFRVAPAALGKDIQAKANNRRNVLSAGSVSSKADVFEQFLTLSDKSKTFARLTT
eukprot:5521253-Amphidinium_carterae.1